MRTLLAHEPHGRGRTAPADARPPRGTLHRVCNILCGIKGYAGLIAHAATPGTEQSAWAERIVHEVERMEAVLRATDDRPRSGAGIAGTAGVDVVSAAAAAAATARHDGFEVVCGDLPGRPAALPDADLDVVLRELLDNSAEGRDGVHGASLARIDAATDPAGRLLLLVADDGPGFAPGVIERATGFRVSTKCGRPGAGLARVATLLDLHGMSMRLGRAPGGGALVTCEVGGPAVGNRTEAE